LFINFFFKLSKINISGIRKLLRSWASCSPEAAADEAEKLLPGGFLSVKLRLGHPNLEQDLTVTRAVRKRLPDAIELPVDYNQALTVAEALRRGRALEGEGVAWLEEPIRHEDYAGNATVARAMTVMKSGSEILKVDEVGRVRTPPEKRDASTLPNFWPSLP
jgi:L-alanine-DL-glutamate epimerase-like enolase superfamily enzyme